MVAYILAHWRGQLSLGRSYWIDSVLVNVLLAAAIYGVGSILRHSASPTLLLVYLCSVVAFGTPLSVWQFVGCWRSASRDQVENKRDLLPVLAKISLVLGAVSGIGNIGRALEQALNWSRW